MSGAFAAFALTLRCNNYITKKARKAIGSADAVGYVFTT
jgi:hypothetical protein